ncbi:hypothetical protein BpHYR1_044320 [Brachionus plicatilis]|uniref:Uncharacterized protein n=1 Tax=Brachionus plicatilis TaxID=10195 RepID=A0A3M7T6S4_BRAPC|nr:hypothetical protein BpHYR1_044320 [Brachionus plicatilis]
MLIISGLIKVYKNNKGATKYVALWFNNDVDDDDGAEDILNSEEEIITGHDVKTWVRCPLVHGPKAGSLIFGAAKSNEGIRYIKQMKISDFC